MSVESKYRATAALWDELSAKGTCQCRHWKELGPVKRNIARKISGVEEVGPWEYVARKYFGDSIPISRALSLGCGAGWLERELAARGLFRKCDAIDLSPGSIEIATKAAQRAGLTSINYFQGNLDYPSFSPECYDAVFAHEILHHLKNLEEVLVEISSSMKESGVLIVDEYVGPARFQFSDREIEVINSAISLLPVQYRRVPSRFPLLERISGMEDRVEAAKSFLKLAVATMFGSNLAYYVKRSAYNLLRRVLQREAYWTPIRRLSPHQLAAYDPSEAVRSADILPLLEKNFEILERKDYGGTILAHGLPEIVGNFVSSSEDAESLIEMLIEIENTLVAHGGLDSHFAFVVARRK